MRDEQVEAARAHAHTRTRCTPFVSIVTQPKIKKMQLPSVPSQKSRLAASRSFHWAFRHCRPGATIPSLKHKGTRGK